MDTLVATTPTSVPASLRKLYFLRFAFAAVWAALLFTSADTLGVLSVTLLVVYPLFDVAAAVVDLRSVKANGGTEPAPSSALAPALSANIAISSAAVISLAVAATSVGIPAVLRVWGDWAVISGIVQLVAGAARRPLGGQWPMITSGAVSTLAGASFFLQAGSDDPTLRGLAGYAFLGGVFFLISGLRLGRAAKGD
ncbi:hypothetical protein [Streptomyces sp. TS71-3]|uniref:hypothetical protein n=1 Tax=Streptomyces sp. TS71-3 TaxID=2733862 RepID=UPI001B02F0C3|nr:hypothetical protein [Streptomyces sp. TS71-3]GHJ40890.1 hypothetical protein Sm713_64990 [Streptomyces sp. TS71-3]